MSYGNLTFVNVETGEITEIPVTNEWVIQNKLNTVELKLNNSQVTLNKDSSVKLNIQIMTPYLVDGSRNFVLKETYVIIRVNEETFEINTDDKGFFQEDLIFSVPDTYVISCENYGSNELTIQVV